MPQSTTTALPVALDVPPELSAFVWAGPLGSPLINVLVTQCSFLCDCTLALSPSAHFSSPLFLFCEAVLPVVLFVRHSTGHIFTSARYCAIARLLQCVHLPSRRHHTSQAFLSWLARRSCLASCSSEMLPRPYHTIVWQAARCVFCLPSRSSEMLPRPHGAIAWQSARVCALTLSPQFRTFLYWSARRSCLSSCSSEMLPLPSRAIA